ncbi:hypothetical protein [Georgenia sp. SYP-B2076]|uniref:hypothetical protein n=1 Tax=Georgenia sp. SYP-B2076 TaxID=2495881 RepID=UPI000F8D03C2|nr:hypothetical protein [Georgenia sp. SYP-B2076]
MAHKTILSGVATAVLGLAMFGGAGTAFAASPTPVTAGVTVQHDRDGWKHDRDWKKDKDNDWWRHHKDRCDRDDWWRDHDGNWHHGEWWRDHHGRWHRDKDCDNDKHHGDKHHGDKHHGDKHRGDKHRDWKD